MFLNDLRNKNQEHKDIKNILEKDYGYTIKSPAYGNSAKKALQQIKDAKQDLYRDFTVEEYNRVVLFEKYLEQLVELDANKWGKGNPNVGGAMALDPTWAGGLRGAGMGAEVTQGHASEKEVKEWLGTKDGKAFITQFKTHGGNVDAAVQDPKLMRMAPAGVIGSVLTANRILMMGRAGVLVAPFLVSNPVGWTILVAVGVIATGAVIAHLITSNKDKETIGSIIDRESEAIASVTGDRERGRPGRTDRDGNPLDRDPAMSQDGELDSNAGIPDATIKRIQQSIEEVSTEIKLGDPNALKDKKAHMDAADKITAIMGSLASDIEYDPEGGTTDPDRFTGTQGKGGVSQQGVFTMPGAPGVEYDPEGDMTDPDRFTGTQGAGGVSQQGVFTMPGAPGVEYDPEGGTTDPDRFTGTQGEGGVSQANIAASIAAFKTAETDKAVSATATAIATAGVEYDPEGSKDDPDRFTGRQGQGGVSQQGTKVPKRTMPGASGVEYDPEGGMTDPDRFTGTQGAGGVSMATDYVIPKAVDAEWGKGRDRHPPITVPTGAVPGTGEVPVDWAGGRDRHPPITGQGVVPGTGAADTTDTGTSTGDKDKVADREQALDREKAKADAIAAAKARAQAVANQAEIVTTTTGAPAIIDPKKDKKKGGGKLKYLGLAALLGGGAAAKKKADKKGRRVIPEPPAQTQLGIGSRWPGGVINASYSPRSDKTINSSIKHRGYVMNEEATFKNLKKLLEQDLDQAELALAAKDMVVQLQDIAEDLAKMQVENLMPLVDRIKEEYGPEAGEQFNGSVESALGAALDGIKGTHEQVQDAVLVLTGEKSAMSNDMGTDDMSMDMGDTDMDDGLGSDDEISLDGADAAAGPADMSLGRAVKKESVVKAKRALQTALREGKYNDKVLRKIIKSMK